MAKNVKQTTTVILTDSSLNSSFIEAIELENDDELSAEPDAVAETIELKLTSDACGETLGQDHLQTGS